MSDDDRINYLAGEPAGALEPAERADLDDLRALLAEPAVWAEPGPGLGDAVIAAVAAAGGAADTARPAAGHRRAGRAPAGLAAVAGRGSSPGWPAWPRRPPPRPPSPSRSARAAEATRFSIRPRCAGTALDPAASAQVTLTQTRSGWRVTLQGRGLPRLDHGYYYEAWLKNRAGILVPIGTFNQPDNVTLWSGVPPTQYPAITITRQQADGNPASSGQRVLARHRPPRSLTSPAPAPPSAALAGTWRLTCVNTAPAKSSERARTVR